MGKSSVVWDNKYCEGEGTRSWAGGNLCSNVQSLRVRVPLEHKGEFKAGPEAVVFLSAQKAKEIGGALGWANEHRHLVLVGDLDRTRRLHPGLSINLHGKGFPGVESDLRALGQAMSSTLELGIDLTDINCTFQTYYFQSLVA